MRGSAGVYITGGTGAVSALVETQIEALRVSNDPTKAFITVVRLGGASRYATNQVANEYNSPTPASLKSTVLLATGKNFADALAVGPIASRKLFPLILTDGVTLGASEKKQLIDFNPTSVVIAGGTGVVSRAIEDSLKGQGYTVLRLSGADRTLTAAQVATWATDGIDDSLGATGTGINAPQGFDSTMVYVTNGHNFADALAAGPVAGAANYVILPSNSPTSLGAGIPLYLGSKTVGTTAGPQRSTCCSARTDWRFLRLSWGRPRRRSVRLPRDSPVLHGSRGQSPRVLSTRRGGVQPLPPSMACPRTSEANAG